MAKFFIHIMLYIAACCLFHGTANAQASITYAEKNTAITLAKAGDADALYVLGLAHFQDSKSQQSTRIAERFFFYSAQKGHPKAKQLLLEIHEKSEYFQKGTSDAYTPDRSIQSSDDNTPSETIIEDKADISENIQIAYESQGLAPSAAATQQQPAPPLIETQSTLENNDIDPSALETTETTIHAIKSAEGSAALTATLPVMSNNKSSPEVLLSGPTKAPSVASRLVKLLYIVSLTVASAILLFFGVRLIKRKVLPDGFASAAYLNLNPDVRDAGLNPIKHYLIHGKKEGRRYQ